MDDDRRSDASLARASGRLLAASTDNAAWCVIVQALYTLDVPKPCPAPTGDAPPPRHGDVARGSEVSLGGFFQNGDIQRLVGHQLLQPSVLFLHRLQFLGHLWLHASVLLTPEVVRLLGNSQQFTNFGDSNPFAKLHIGSTQHRDNLTFLVTLLNLLKILSWQTPNMGSLRKLWDRLWGEGLCSPGMVF